jgi:integrase
MTEPRAHTVAGAIEAYIDDRRDRGEITRYTARQFEWRLSPLASLWGDLPIGELSREHLRAWQARSGRNSPATRRAYLSAMRTFIRWCNDEDLLKGDPAAGLGRVKEPWREPRALDADQMRALRAVLPDTEARLMVELMASQGLRCIEVANLAVPDWDRSRGRIRVSGKAAEERSIPLADHVAELMAACVGERRLGPVITGRSAPSGPLKGRSRQMISKMVGRWIKGAGLKSHGYDGVSAHALRHTAASNLYEACGDVKAVQRFLGHANVATTDRYLRYGDDDVIRQGLNRISA